MTLGLFGGAFDPPHVGHVAVVREAKHALGLERVVVLVTAAPGHKDVSTPPESRLELARAAFPEDEVRLDGHARTVDLLRAHPEWHDAIFLVGADEFCHFLDWKMPDEVLRLARLGVATRPGYPRERLQTVLAGLEQPERVLFFDFEPVAAASVDVRGALARGDDVSEVIPAAVRGIIEREGLYRTDRSYTRSA